MESTSPGAPGRDETAAAARALVHRLANELSLITGYAELLGSHVHGAAGAEMLADVEQASRAAEQLTVQLAVLLQSVGDAEAARPESGARFPTSG
jgi:hypothetical protein